MSVAANIKRYREHMNLTQGDLAEKLGVARSTVTQWENGWSSPRMGMVQKLAGVLRVSTSDIVSDAALDAAPDETAVVRNMRRMAPEGRAALLATSDALAAQFPLQPAENCRGGVLHA